MKLSQRYSHCADKDVRRVANEQNVIYPILLFRDLYICVYICKNS